MCGIAGIYSANQVQSAGDMERMTRCLSHRGPDADGFFTDEYVALGHRRLSIIDLSAEANQPMTSHDGRWVMMFNGEVFNFREIAETLPVIWKTHSDTEVMLELFASKGPAAVSQFNGMFTIALYDKQLKNLYLFRDRMGVKPLFCLQAGSSWYFASEIKALARVELIRKNLTVNKEAISHYLQLGYIPEPHTIWREIKKFPAGYYLRISSRDHEWKCYWKAEEKILPSVITDRSVAKAQLHSLLEDAVRLRMISDVPFGTFLSGGIDSSLITALAQQQSSAPVKTFTIGFREEKFNESNYASAIARHLGTEHHEMILGYRDAQQLCEESMDIYDEPFADSSAIPTMLVSRMARKDVKMILSGDGGDELFMGYGMYRWRKRLNQPFIKALRRPIGQALSGMGQKYQRAAGVLQYENEESLPRHIFSQEQSFFSEQETRQLLGPGFQRSEEAAPHQENRKLSVSERQALFDLKFYLKDDLLVKVDRATMNYSLECRTPFLDYRLVEFALNVSEKLKMKNGELKLLPRLLLADLLPPKLFERPKRGFAIPLQHWLKKELRYLVTGYLGIDIIQRYGWVDPEKVEVLKKDFFNGKQYLYNRLWNLIVLHRWLEKNS